MASFRILTFGCKVNQCDSQIIRETLTSWNFRDAQSAKAHLTEAEPVPPPDSAVEASADEVDLIVVNTCTVTGTADAKFRKAIRRAKRENPSALIAVTGCYANRPDDICQKQHR